MADRQELSSPAMRNLEEPSVDSTGTDSHQHSETSASNEKISFPFRCPEDASCEAIEKLLIDLKKEKVLMEEYKKKDMKIMEEREEKKKIGHRMEKEEMKKIRRKMFEEYRRVKETMTNTLGSGVADGSELNKSAESLEKNDGQELKKSDSEEPTLDTKDDDSSEDSKTSASNEIVFCAGRELAVEGHKDTRKLLTLMTEVKLAELNEKSEKRMEQKREIMQGKSEEYRRGLDILPNALELITLEDLESEKTAESVRPLPRRRKKW